MITVAARDKTGVVILRDHRDDGSYVLLECRVFSPGGDGGVVVLPDEEEFPMLRAAEETERLMRLEAADEKPFSLEVDVSAMPPGGLRFNNGKFVRQAAEAAQVGERARITPDNARRWGFLGRLRKRRR
jgi:hypothetical protein